MEREEATAVLNAERQDAKEKPGRHSYRCRDVLRSPNPSKMLETEYHSSSCCAEERVCVLLYHSVLLRAAEDPHYSVISVSLSAVCNILGNPGK